MSTEEKQKKILIVDDEEDMVWSLQNYLENDNLNVKILTAGSAEAALLVLAADQVDLVITDIKMPGMSGLDLLIEIKNRYPHIMVIVMTAFPSSEYKKKATLRGSLHFIEKPFDLKMLRDMVREALEEESRFRGTVAGVGLSEVIQIQGLSRATAALRVREGNKEGILYFYEGEIIHAICEDLEGEEAFFRLMEFQKGALDSSSMVEMPAQTIERSLEALLMESAQRLDESTRQLESEAATGSDVFVLSDDALDNDVVELSEDGRENESEVIANSKIYDVEDEMSDLKSVLTEFTNIPGVHTACLVGRDGFLLDSIAMSGIDTEMIGAIASSGFGASESMGNQLGKGRMNMSMIEYDDGPVLLSPVGNDAFLVIVGEKDVNLGMIRLKIKKHTIHIAETAAI